MPAPGSARSPGSRPASGPCWRGSSPARLRGSGERANAQLKSWRILQKL
ncbi:hypothetical protein GT755_34760 [Herbidospora sp. NEAU-GS84]|uniref:Transposase n=1 Tax=Herbidospora solisilvae TaxID=2696284 RepID=A0A7C9K1F2_9ACTN|nr:hypothetical protein [Herbidospora solisilvae]